jgi:hypothetical protein
VLDVHPPHASIQHRHVMHQAQASLLIEIKANASGMQARLEALQKQRQDLKPTVEALTRIIANPAVQYHDSLGVKVDLTGFDNVSWATA